MGNNPVTFVDPNGEELITSLIAGAVIGAWIGAATTIATGGDINDIGNAALFGAISGLASAGVGSAFSGTGAILGGNAAAQAGAHGLVQGSLSAIQGGDFGTGFVSGALSSGVSTALNDLGPLAQIGGAGVVGGITSELSGGKFADGLTRGVSIALLNHVLHRGVDFGRKQQNPCPKCPELTIMDQLEMMEAHRMGMSYVLADGEGNYLYYHPNGSIEYSNSPPGMKALQLGVSTMLFELPKSMMTGLARIFTVSRGKGFESFSAFKRAMGSAGSGKAWHHIVEQGGNNVARFGAKRIHNTKNLIKIEHGKGSLHARVSGYYSSKQPFTDGLTVRQWLRTQSFSDQYKFGIKTLKQFGWKP